MQFLAIESTHPGNGLFRDFIAAVKKEFDRIDIWFVTTSILTECLPRYGFRPHQERQFLAALNEWESLEGYRWDR